MFFWLRNLLRIAFVSSTSLLLLFLSFWSIPLEKTNFIRGENLFTDSIYIFWHYSPFRQIIGRSMYNEGIRLILTSSSTSSKMVYVVPPGKCLLLTRLSFDSLFSFVPFNNKSPDYVYIKDSNRLKFNRVMYSKTKYLREKYFAWIVYNALLVKKLTNHQKFCLDIKDKQAAKMSNESSTVQFDIYHFIRKFEIVI